MASSMMSENTMDEDIVCVKKVKMSWYENDLSSNRGWEDIYRVVEDKFDFLYFFIF
jgi:hypothetical protein